MAASIIVLGESLTASKLVGLLSCVVGLSLYARIQYQEHHLEVRKRGAGDAGTGESDGEE